MKQNNYESVLSIFYDKILQTLSTSREGFILFNTSIEANQNVNDLFTGSNC